MDKSQVIKEMVQRFINDEKLFTSVDIGNAIKKELLSMEIRNREVRDWLRSNIGGVDDVLKDYVAEPINVNNGASAATLYRPHWKDASEYTDRDQIALSPADIDILKDNAKPQAQATVDLAGNPIVSAINAVSASSTPVNSIPVPTPVATPVARNNDSHIDIPDIFDDGSHPDSKVQIVRENKYVRRIQIPGDITRALGWKPGQKVEFDKIKIHTGTLNPNLKVWPDGRCSIPRKVVGYGQDPVKIILKDDAIYFEKA
jgi:hypothetical protein